jgi:hypothetical protein
MALLIRVFTFQFHPTIEGDGIHYASLARSIVLERDLKAGLQPYRASFYQFIVAATALLIKDVELAGRLVSAAMGSLLVIPVFSLGSRLFSEVVGWISAVLVVVHQVLIRYSAMLYVESTFLFLLYAGLALAWLLLKRKTVGCALMTGFLMGMSACIHPQGSAYIGIPLITLMLQFATVKAGNRLVLARLTLALLLAFAIAVVPFYLMVGATGGQTPVGSKVLVNLIGGEDIDATDPQRTVERMRSLDEDGSELGIRSEMRETSVASYIFNHLGELASRCYRNLGKLDRDILQQAIRPSQLTGTQTLFAIFVVLGVFGVPWRKETAGSQLYLLTIVAYVFALQAIFFFHTRLVLPILPVFLIWAASGIAQLGTWIRRTLMNLGFQSFGDYPTLFWTALLILFSLFLVNNLRLGNAFVDPVAVHDKQIGLWMKAHLSQDTTIMTDNPYVPFYFFDGRQRYVALPYDTCERVVGYAQANQVDYVVVTERRVVDLHYPCGFFDDSAAISDLELVKEWELAPPQNARLFRVEWEE